MTVTCACCGQPFEAKRRTARFCSATCRSRARRTSSPPVRGQRDKGRAKPGADSALVVAVRRELEEAGQLATVEGQLALMLAAQSATVAASALATLSVELRRLMALALARGAQPEDDVTRARRAREEKRRQLGLGDDA